MNILVISPAWVGDTVMMQPMIARLRQYHPTAHITVMAPAWCQGLLTRMPGVDASIENPFAHGALQLGRRRRLGLSLKGRFERCYVLPNSFKSALLPWFAGIPRRTGFIGEMRYGLLSDARVLDRDSLPLMVERFALLAEERNTSLPGALLQPVLSSSTAQQQATLQRLGLDRTRPMLALCPGAEFGPAKRWPTGHFAGVARQALHKGWQVLVLGSGKDAPLAEDIVREAPGTISLCGRTTLEDVIDLLAAARHAVSNDSGLMHIAAAVKTPLVAIYGSSSPGFTPPLSHTAVIESLKLDCSPCFERSCPLGHTACLNELKPERILHHLAL